MDFLLFLRKAKHLSVLAVRGYSSALSAVLKFRLPDLSTNFVLRDLICSFELERPSAPVGPPSWDLVKVLEYLHGPVFEPLSSKPLRLITIKTLFLLSLATAKWVGELQALWRRVVSQGPDILFLICLNSWRRWSQRGILFLVPSSSSPCLSLLGPA